MPSVDLERYAADGFLIVDVLEGGELQRWRDLFESLLGRHRPAPSGAAAASAYQHLGDPLDDYGQLAKHYYFHLLTDPRSLPSHALFHDPVLLEAAERLLGPGLVIDNASLLAAEPGTRYQLPWHRDVIQIPESEIVPEAIYTPLRFHNNVQINLALYPDAALWVIPGSHRRCNTPVEEQEFAGSKHYAPLSAELSGALNVPLRAGQAVLYNNNLIHRGYQPAFPNCRRCVHIGYHSRTRPPTWHFYFLNESLFTPEYLASMTPRVRQMLADHFERRREYPEMRLSWPR